MKVGGLVRQSEFAKAGITAATIRRLKDKNLVVQPGRGLYQLPDAPLEEHQSLAEVAKRVPRGVVCLVSALAYHGLTDTIPSRVWIAIGPRDHRPIIDHPRVHFVRFGERVLHAGIVRARIGRVDVPVYGPAKTVVDMFRYRQSAGRRYKRSPGLALALEGLREALRQRKATPAQIARYAEEGGVWKVVRPYLEAMTANG
ncbi:MAG: type IV toxin-antitoxin system AbiEi family antitoxin domain-containing protein [Reyranellaceae bacterium]